MLKKILTILAMLYAAASFAAVDVNKATAAELDGIKGIGPGLSGKIIEERKHGAFKDWDDFIQRVRGVGETSAGKFSAEGMRVNGRTFKAHPPPPNPPPPHQKISTPRIRQARCGGFSFWDRYPEQTPGQARSFQRPAQTAP